jgi:hypothetical protein
MGVDLPIVYGILRDIAIGHTLPITHQELSRRYHGLTGNWIDPFRGWSRPLGVIHAWCANHYPRKLPPLPVLVISAWTGLPDAEFWGRWGTPLEASVGAWRFLCGQVYGADWPAELD